MQEELPPRDGPILESLTGRLPPTVLQVLFIFLLPVTMFSTTADILTGTLRYFGVRQSARWAYRMAKYRYRAPLYDLLLLAPGPMLAATLFLCSILIYIGPPEIVKVRWFILPMLFWAGALKMMAWTPALPAITIAFGCVMSFVAPASIVVIFIWYVTITWVLFGISSSILNCVAPGILYLGISGYEQCRTMKRLQGSTVPMVISLTNQQSGSVIEHYRDHYGWRGMDPTTPRWDSLRTRDNLWQRTVLELSDDIAIIVLDLRETSQIVRNELMMVMTGPRLVKTIFVIDNIDQRQQIAKIISDPAVLAEVDRRTCNENALIEKIKFIMQSPSSFSEWMQAAPTELDFEASQQAIATFLIAGAEKFNALASAIAKGRGQDEKLEAEIAAFAGMEWPSEENAGFTRSVDAAASMVKRYFQLSSITLHIHVNNLGQAELGIRNPHGVFRVFVSDDNIDPARAVLQAFVKAAFGESA